MVRSVGPETSTTACYPAGRSGVAFRAILQGFDALARAEQGGEVSARREAQHADELRIKPVFVGVGAHPADRRLAIEDLRRETRHAAQAVVHAGHGVTRRRVQRGVILRLRLVADPPATAVQEQNHRLRAQVPGIHRKVQVERQSAPTRVTVHHIAQRIRRLSHRLALRQQDATRQGQPRRDRQPEIDARRRENRGASWMEKDNN